MTLARLEARGLHDVAVTPGWDGYRVRVLVESPGEATAAVEAVRLALTVAVAEGAPELATVQRRLDALAHRPMADAALADAVRCTGEPFAQPGDPLSAPDAATVEGWRRAAHVHERAAFAVVGQAALTEAVARAVAAGPAWPASPGGPSGDGAESAEGAPLVYYEAADLAPGTAQVTLAFHTARAEEAVAAADTLGDARGALVTRLGALDSPPRLTDVTATAHAGFPRGEGCLCLTLSFSGKDLGEAAFVAPSDRSSHPNDAPSRIATAVALARQEVMTELADAAADRSLGRLVANRAGDPRDAAERAAWWTLVDRGSSRTAADAHATLRTSIAVGLATGRDATRRPEGVPAPLAFHAPGPDPASVARADAIRNELDRATIAWHEPVVEARSRVQSGQGELWLLLASPCGTLAEAEADAGLGAVVALATAERAPLAVRSPGSSMAAEPWVSSDGIGVIVHGPPLPAESPTAHARRLADAAARSFAADPLDPDAVAHARATLLGRSGSFDTSRAFSTLAGVLSPGHPSWTAPFGTAEALGRSSDAAVSARASALRAGPLRVAVLANVDASQSEAAVRAVDRWVARRPGEVRACLQPATTGPVRPGTYAVETVGASSSEAWLALALPPDDAAARLNATLLAAALDGPDGLLAHVLGAGFARGWGARVTGSAHAPALVVRIDSVQGALDAAVAETRALFERLRQGGLAETDRARAIARSSSTELASSLDPKNRLVALWRGDASGSSAPSLDALRAFCTATLQDEALVLLAARPGRDPRASHAREPRTP